MNSLNHQLDQQREGLIFVISAPSGAGKTSLVKSLLEDSERLGVCISHTTRSPREGEINGQAYHFVDKAQFELNASKGQFIEYAKVFDHYYGTSKKEVKRIVESGSDVILEIDWQGAKQVMELFAKNTVSIFIVPPSIDALKERLTKRGKDSEEVIRKRLEKSKWEIKEYDCYDYLLINDDFEYTLSNLQAIIQGERIRHQKYQVEAFIQGKLL